MAIDVKLTTRESPFILVGALKRVEGSAKGPMAFDFFFPSFLLKSQQLTKGSSVICP
jgi:hypothetical protein